MRMRSPEQRSTGLAARGVDREHRDSFAGKTLGEAIQQFIGHR